MFSTSLHSVILSFFILKLFTGCTGQNGSIDPDSSKGIENPEDAAKQGYIQFDTLQHNFGTLIEGEQVVSYFDYINSGKGTLVIQSVKSSCGCTVADYSSKPLEPGEKGTVKVVFDTSGRNGEQVKIITITSDAKNPEVKLRLTANIMENK